MFNQPCIGEAILLNYTLRALEMAEAHGPTICVEPLYAAAWYTGGVAQVGGPTLCSLDLQFPTVVSRERHCIKWRQDVPLPGCRIFQCHGPVPPPFPWWHILWVFSMLNWSLSESFFLLQHWSPKDLESLVGRPTKHWWGIAKNCKNWKTAK